MHLNKANTLGILYAALVKQITKGGNMCMVYLLFVFEHIPVGWLTNILFKMEMTKWLGLEVRKSTEAQQWGWENDQIKKEFWNPSLENVFPVLWRWCEDVVKILS